MERGGLWVTTQIQRCFVLPWFISVATPSATATLGLPAAEAAAASSERLKWEPARPHSSPHKTRQPQLDEAAAESDTTLTHSSIHWNKAIKKDLAATTCSYC